ncbi:hypothetical protein PGT21_021610 [Puccinia graminis f. sp. tritici]|uniref:30S ribosomal protein S8 n=2 Tax=Puccinia graminis f. sp. tritici TaxID=56615 RepID=E3KCM6_PUCGT|nr:mitochondrial 37S ribosomal protein MRPS8 [Puccinia graminis f. sp. tritici CRL 75-36-700-3]KAA1064984.1 hypothetical protein PGT21_020882 [Puccinia graminis f. sp. tritici]EFP82178.1 30S ribosomal protein S8 [Puccinia graminis f. sp. tritici CRL 75-36-700-3]KAA1071111.1 hypothetical protein PGTUg99_016237 [Puccinia graminis f. sp. tritici]KAA1085850.1 hypothetical protein PGT21_021610 [Puccinia graminis f. sp. tritici]KAA1090368.1 hypothetical protein PGTUg99_002101 [Puccinia graminis f. s
MSRRIIKPSLPYDLCAHLQNTARSRLRTVPVPSSGLHQSLLTILLDQGFISNLTRGTKQAPDPAGFLAAPISQRRLWIEHKFRDEQPVLRNARLVSKPSLRVYHDRSLLNKFVDQKISLGEICIVRSVDGLFLWEAREALKHLDNHQSVEVLCRVSS